VDAGYTSTDYVLDQVKNRPECKYLSITNADNVYGSNVISSVLRSSKYQAPGESAANMILVPLDSRNFAEHGTYRTSAKR
jgi:hypothetical protein